MFEQLVAALVTGSARVITGAQCQWLGCGPHQTQRVYFANHASHLDFILLWSALPPALRDRTRPVAAADYWFRGKLRQYLMGRVFHGVPVGRSGATSKTSPLQPMLDALDDGWSLILFPEGTRGGGEDLQPFKSGIFHLARMRPGVDLVPVWIDNCYRVMPKGSFLPVPLLCSIRFGEPTRLGGDEDQFAFLDRLSKALEALR